MPEYYIGIDLGTTNTTCSVLRRGKVDTLSVEGEPICPSVVCFQGEDDYLVGRSAKRRMMIDPEHTVVSAKRNMGRLKCRYKQYGKKYSPAQISSFILKKIKEETEKELGPINKAVITVPAYFNDDQRANTKKAAELAGFEVLRLLSEPTAAAVAYGLNQGKDQTIAVYDLGGGTFDISILEVKENTFAVKAVGGNPQLGGDDFDRVLSDYVAEQFSKETGIDLNKEPKNAEMLAARQKLKEECRKKKEELSESEEAPIEIPNFYKGHHLEVTVTKDTFEELIMSYVDNTVKDMKETLDKARLRKEDIDRVILVGGSTHIPLVRKKVAQTIKEPYVAENVMEMVCRGAAIVAAQYMAIYEKGDEKIREVIKVSTLKELTDSLQELYPYSLGIAVTDLVPPEDAGRYLETMGEKDGMSLVHGIFSEIVALGTKTPLNRKRGGYSTVVDNATQVKIEIYRTAKPGKERLGSCKDEGMQCLGDFLLRGIPPAPAGEPQITVTMDIDDDGILNVKAEGKMGGEGTSEPIYLWVDRELDRLEDGEEGCL